MNRVDPALFAACFEAWVADMWPGFHEFIAIDGKTARRTHGRGKGLKALHTLSAYAANARLTLENDVAAYFRTAQASEIASKTTVEKGHGRIKTRTYLASSHVDLIDSDRRDPALRASPACHPDPGSQHHRTSRPDRLRDQILPLLRQPRRRIQGRPVTRPPRPRSQQHGHRQPYPTRPRAKSPIQGQRQHPTQTRRLEPRLPGQPPAGPR